MSSGFDDGNQAFHYNRADRLKLGGRDREQDKKKGIFKQNRSLIIILIDIVVIVIVFILLQLLWEPSRATYEIYGYAFRLRAVEFEDEVLYTLTISPEEPVKAMEGTLVGSVFEAGEHSTRVSDVLPGENVSERVLRARSALGSNVEDAQATVTVGKESFTLYCDIQQE
jgi:hypothetical protein